MWQTLLRYTVSSALWLLLSCRVSALGFQYLAVEDGLSSNIVYRTIQDQKGLIWAGPP